MKKFLLFTLILVFAIIPMLALADGMIIGPPDKIVYEKDQQAVIFYEKGYETLIISVTFNGNARDFAWIVPTPNRPDVSKSTTELFESLDELTEIEYDYERSGLDLGMYGAAVEGVKSVTVLEKKKVGYYDVTVLEATDANALQEWLSEHDYYYPTSATYILDDYVENGWYFTAIKIDVSSLHPTVSSQLREGQATPLKLYFKTDAIVYPLKISSVIHEPKTWMKVDGEMQYTNIKNWRKPTTMGIMLYVIAENKQNLTGFSTEYAGPISKDALKKLATEDSGKPWISPSKKKYFLTKLYKDMSVSKMTHDLYTKQAANNETVNYVEEVVNTPGKMYLVIILGSVFSVILLLILLFYGKIKIGFKK